MKRIILIVPYFGKLPYNFQLWLEGCRYNPSIDWIIYTDDRSKYNYPSNVKVVYISFDEMKMKIQLLYDFDIALNKAYKLCDFKVAYGEIFYEDIKGYDYWGYCDVDLLFGNIRKFITDDILVQYNKIGFQGHLTIYSNDIDTITRYRTEGEGLLSYKQVFSSEQLFCFDESGMDYLYEYLNISVYKEVHFAHLKKYNQDFFLAHFSEEDNYKNKDQIFTWEKGRLLRKFLVQETIYEEEFLYIHFFCRNMNIRNIQKYSDMLVIYPNKIERLVKPINKEYIKKKAHTSKIRFEIQRLWRKRKQISFRKIISYMRNIKGLG